MDKDVYRKLKSNNPPNSQAPGKAKQRCMACDIPIPSPRSQNYSLKSDGTQSDGDSEEQDDEGGLQFARDFLSSKLDTKIQSSASTLSRSHHQARPGAALWHPVSKVWSELDRCRADDNSSKVEARPQKRHRLAAATSEYERSGSFRSVASTQC